MKLWTYALKWPLANIGSNRTISIMSITAAALATCIVVTTLGFLSGYQQGVKRDMDGLGFDLLLTAKGCPYEAATLMLRGGTGMRYIPDGVLERLKADPDVRGIHPMLIHAVKVEGEAGTTLFKGVGEGFFETQRLTMKSGVWLSESGGLVLGSELAEFEQRKVGDDYLVSTASHQEERRPVLGILQRTGTQLDGMVLMSLRDVQRTFDLSQRLTAIGLDVASPRLPMVRTRYHEEEPLQVVSLSHIEDALRQATESLSSVLSMLAWALLVMTSVVLINASVLRTAAAREEHITLHRIGFSGRFMLGVAFIENMLLVGCGALVGLLTALALQGWSVSFLLSHLPYAPKGPLLSIDTVIIWAVCLSTVGVAALATLPAIVGLRKASALDGGL